MKRVHRSEEFRPTRRVGKQAFARASGRLGAVSWTAALVCMVCVSVLVPAAPVLAQAVVHKADDLELTLSGFARVRGNRYESFDLNPETRADAARTFYDARAYLTLGARRGDFGAVFSIDLAGNDFNDGIQLGNDDPALVRRFELDVRHLWIEYDGLFNARLGRQPGRFGNSIIAHVNRDAFRAWKAFDGWLANASLIKGGETLENPPTGEDDDLDALLLSLQRQVGGGTFKIEWTRQFDSSPNERLPEKEYFGLNGRGVADELSYAFELALQRGRTPDTGSGALEYEANLAYGEAHYRLGSVEPGLRLGRGSGDDDPTDDKLGDFAVLFVDETHFAYTNLFADDIHGWDGTSASLARGAGFANVTFVQPRVRLHPRPRLTVEGSVTRLWATEERVVGTGPLGRGVATGTETSRDLGVELDLNGTYQLEAKTRAFATLGWFDPGEVFGADAESALKLEIGLELAF